MVRMRKGEKEKDEQKMKRNRRTRAAETPGFPTAHCCHGLPKNKVCALKAPGATPTDRNPESSLSFLATLSRPTLRKKRPGNQKRRSPGPALPGGAGVSRSGPRFAAVGGFPIGSPSDNGANGSEPAPGMRPNIAPGPAPPTPAPPPNGSNWLVGRVGARGAKGSNAGGWCICPPPG